ncbi:hypothetical protein ABIC20_006002 [Methylobacterium radiotolerans]|uniref:NAD-specific glutamate dehydrogenase n=1 Tax=Methylobacterium radiotolerans TaxID=31998 RepID=A0ABV2NQD0_9HYPH
MKKPIAAYSRFSVSAIGQISWGGDTQGHVVRHHAAEHVGDAGGLGLRRAGRELHDRLHRREGAGPVRLDAVERPRLDEALQGALVDHPGVQPAGEAGEVLERPVAAGLHQRPHRLAPDALDGGQRVEDLAVAHLEHLARGVDRGRLDRDLQALGVLAEFGQLVGVVDVEGHGGGQELDREVRLQVGSLVGQQRVGRRVALVEAVIGELGEQVEDLVGLGLGQAALGAALQEPVALRVHLGADLLAHGAPEHVGLAERVAGEHLGDLHHLFLVDDDAEGLLQHRLQLRVRVPGRLVAGVAAELALAVDRDVGHRARPVERHQGDDVLQPVGLHLAERLAHAGRFHLEHADRLAPAHGPVGVRVVERQRGEVDVDAALLEEIRAAAQHGQGLEAQEVELHQPRLLDPLHVELGHAHAGLRVSVERDQLLQGPVADHHAGGVGRGVAVQAFQLLGDVDEPTDDRLLLHGLLEFGLALDRLGEGHRVGRVLRHELGQLVDLPVRHLEDAADIAQHAAGEQRTEGDDLPDLPLAVALLHVLDHPLAALDAEIDVEIRHRDALGVEEALEQQAEAQRVEVGDQQRPRHQRAGAGAAARAHRDVVVLGPLDEVRDDQEVARELHLDDDVELEGEALAVILLGEAGRRAVLLQAQFQPRLGLPAQLGRLVGRDRLRARVGRLGQGIRHGRRLARRYGAEIRQDRLAGPRPDRAAHGDLDRGLERVRQVAEQLGHLGAGLEGVRRRQPAAAVVGDEAALRDGEQRVVGVVIVRLGEEGLVRRHDPEAVPTGEVEERGLDPPLLGQAVALDLHVEPVLAEGLF